jgi:hypothetical protein
MAIDITINPLKGIFLPLGKYNGKEKEFIFGMTQDEIARISGEPARYEVNHLIKTINEPRDGMMFIYEYETFEKRHEPHLIAIEMLIDKGVNVLYEGINLFESKNEEIIDVLKKYDENPTPDNGKYMIFFKLGIMLGGYGKKRIPEKKLMYQSGGKSLAFRRRL